MLSCRKDVYTENMKWFFTRQKAPAMYGAVHITFLISIMLCVCLLCLILQKKTQKQVLKILHACGIMLAATEVFKQMFLYHINGYFDWWRFPFQICSVPMYLCLILPLTKGKMQKTILCYLDSFCLLGALCALLFPQDMLSVWPVLTFHSFFWHGILIFISGLVVSHHMEGNTEDFIHACLLFLCCAGIAEFINFTGAHVSAHALPDMFYISPYTETLQPFFRKIQQFFGRAIEIFVYLLFYMLGCAGIHFSSGLSKKRKHTA